MPARNEVEVAPDVWLRRGGVGRSLAVFLSGFVTVLFGIFTLLGGAATVVRPEESLATLLAITGGFALAAAVFGTLTARLARAGLRITHSAVCLRGIARTHHMTLAEVSEFVPGVFRSLGAREMGVKIQRAAMPDLDVWALGIGSAITDAEREEVMTVLQPLCERLNRLLGEMRRTAPGPSHCG